VCFSSWFRKKKIDRLKIGVALIGLVSRMGHQTALLAWNKIHPYIRHHVNGLTIRHIRPIAPEPNRIHGLSLKCRIARDYVNRIDGTGVTHHYPKYYGLGSPSLLLQRKVWAHHSEAGRSHGCFGNNPPSGRRRGSPILQKNSIGYCGNRDHQSRRKHVHPDESRVAFRRRSTWQFQSEAPFEN
jgi:hypothetical protein